MTIKDSGKDIAFDLGVEKGDEGVWIFADCVVVEKEVQCDPMFDVYMIAEKGGIVVQTVVPDDEEQAAEDRRNLDDGNAPTQGWEDGIGNSVCPTNGAGVHDLGYTFVWSDGKDGATEVYRYELEALERAQEVWDYSKWDDRYAMTSGAGCFVVYNGDPDEEDVVHDWTEDAEKTTPVCIETPYGPRKIHLPGGDGGIWDLIADYDKAHGTHIFDLYDVGDIDWSDDEDAFAGVADYDPKEEPPMEIETVAKITSIGTSLGVYLTKEFRAMNLDRGDNVKIIIKRV